jgi:hypothetical protein
VAGIAIYSYAGSLISNCVNNAAIEGTGYAAVGGLVGELVGRLEYSANHGNVAHTGCGSSRSSASYTGGLAARINSLGSLYQADIYNCYNAGSVTSTPATENAVCFIGGLVGGYSTSSYAFQEDYGIVNSFNFGTVDLVGTGTSAAIIGAKTAQTASTVTAAHVAQAEFDNVFYLDGCADYLFGYNSEANNNLDAYETAKKFMKKDSAYFISSLTEDLNAGDGGTHKGSNPDDESDDTKLWEISVLSGFPILTALGDKPLAPPQKPNFEEQEEEEKPDTLKGQTREIYYEQDLRDFFESVNLGGNYLNAELMNNLTLNEQEWTNFVAAKAYNGEFDGNGKTITLTDKKDNIMYPSLFFEIGEDGRVMDLKLNVDFSGHGSGIAALAFRSFGRVERVTVRGKIELTGMAGHAAGLVVEASGPKVSFTECANYADITGSYSLGGIADLFNGRMESCANYGDITASDNSLTNPSIGGLISGSKDGFDPNDACVYINCYNAGTISAPNNTDKSLLVAALFGTSLPCRAIPAVDFTSTVLNCYNYGNVFLENDELGALFVGNYNTGPSAFRKTENVFYREGSVGRIVRGGTAVDDDGWFIESLRDKAKSMDAEQFRDSTVLNLLIDYQAQDGSYPGREGGVITGRAKWVQSDDLPVLWALHQNLPRPEIPTPPNTETGTDPEEEGEPTEEEPETPKFEVDRTDTESPAVIVKVDPVKDVTIDESSGTETVYVPEGALIGGIEEAISVASEAGETAEPTLEIKVEEATAVNIIKVEIPVEDLEAVAKSEVVNVKIATAVGEVTLNTGAIKDLITKAESQRATVVEIDVERKETLEDEFLTEEQKAVLSDDAGTALREVYDVSVVINSSKQENFETQGKVTIGLPYALKQGEIAEGVWVIHVKADGATERMEESRKYERNTAYFKTSHLSVYAIMYEVGQETKTQVDDINVSGGCSSGAAMTAALLAAAFVMTRINKKGRKG